jgi:hypothetical protein
MIETKIELEKEYNKYPYIGISKKDCIVLFDKENCGMCLDGGLTLNGKGKYIISWDEPQFTIFNGTIILTNK